MITNFPSTLPQSTSSRRRTIWASTALAAVLALTGCGSSSSPSSNSPAGGSAAPTGRSTTTSSSAVADPSSGVSVLPSAHAGGGYCSLLTASEARAVVGDGLAPGVSRTATTPKIGGQTGSCVYKLVHPTTVPTVVNLIVLGTRIPRSLYDTEITQSADKSTTPVPGLGETAFGGAGFVTVYDHGLVLALEIIKGGKPVAVATLVSMLRTALSRAGGLR